MAEDSCSQDEQCSQGSNFLSETPVIATSYIGRSTRSKRSKTLLRKSNGREKDCLRSSASPFKSRVPRTMPYFLQLLQMNSQDCQISSQPENGNTDMASRRAFPRNVQESHFNHVRFLKRVTIFNTMVGRPDIGLPTTLKSLIHLEEINIVKNKHLEYLPEIFNKEHTKLKRVNLQRNSLRELPKSLGKLPAVEELDVSMNAISSIPATIFSKQVCSTLKFLNLSQNELEGLPWQIGNLRLLLHLDVRRNFLQSFPSEIANLDSVLEIKACGNRIEALEECISSLCQLQLLSLRENCIHSMPESIWSSNSLKTLDLAKNRLQCLIQPERANRSLQYLYVNGNNIESVQAGFLAKFPNLKEFDLSFNKIYTLPYEDVCAFPRRCSMHLLGNPLHNVPKRIRCRSSKELLETLRAHQFPHELL